MDSARLEPRTDRRGLGRPPQPLPGAGTEPPDRSRRRRSPSRRLSRRRRRPTGSSMIVFEAVSKVYDPDVDGAPRRLLRDRQGRVRLRRRRVGLGQVDDDPAAAQGDRADARADHRRRPRPRPAQALEGADAAPQRRLRLPGLQAAARTARRPRTSPTRSRCRARAATRSARRCPRCSGSSGSPHKMSSYPDELSGGEQQRVSIARAVVNHPPLLICDEPTGNLDPDTSVGIMQLLYRINRAGHDDPHGHPRPRDGGQDAQARDRARGGPARARRAPRGLRVRVRLRSSSPRRCARCARTSRRPSRRR